MFELVAAAVPDRDAVVDGDRRWTFRELDRRANRVANLLLSWTLPPRTRVAILSSNRIEWVEVMLGAFKARATPLSLRLGATAEEARDVLDGVGAEVLVYETRFSPVVSAVTGQVPSLRHLLTLGDGEPDHPAGVGATEDHRTAVGATDYEVALAVRSEAVPGLDRSPDDLYMVYEPGAAHEGRAPAAAWRHEDLFFAELGGGRRDGAAAPVTSPVELVDRLAGDSAGAGAGLVDRVTGPLGDAEVQRQVLATLLAGRTVVLAGVAAAGLEAGRTTDVQANAGRRRAR